MMSALSKHLCPVLPALSMLQVGVQCRIPLGNEFSVKSLGGGKTNLPLKVHYNPAEKCLWKSLFLFFLDSSKVVKSEYDNVTVEFSQMDFTPSNVDAEIQNANESRHVINDTK